MGRRRPDRPPPVAGSLLRAGWLAGERPGASRVPSRNESSRPGDGSGAPSARQTRLTRWMIGAPRPRDNPAKGEAARENRPPIVVVLWGVGGGGPPPPYPGIL